MSKLTFVIEFEDGKEPPVHAHMEAFGGKVVAVAFRDAVSEQEEREQIVSTYDPINTIRCAICDGVHKPSDECPLITVFSVINHG